MGQRQNEADCQQQGDAVKQCCRILPVGDSDQDQKQERNPTQNSLQLFREPGGKTLLFIAEPDSRFQKFLGPVKPKECDKGFQKTSRQIRR